MTCVKLAFKKLLIAIAVLCAFITGIWVSVAADTNDFTFTTSAYKTEALHLVIREANQVAKELNLTNELPITYYNIQEYFIGPYGSVRYTGGGIGTVTTKNYFYCISKDEKFSYLDGTHQWPDQVKWSKEYSLPANLLDTNAAYQLAAQWLKDVSIDVPGLNRDLNLHIEATWLGGVGDTARYAPLYWVYWVKGPIGNGSAASVGLFLPTKTLTSLRVEDPKYNLRKPLQFTNLDYLISQTNSP